jgi:3-hydroxyisobutyrate dehydrogenase-like beta-hydroxyacid dehydrogenase
MAAVGFIGFIGLGNMGGALAANLVGAGHQVVAHDVAGPDRCPEGAEFVADASAVAARASVIVFSLPDGDVALTVARALAASPERTVGHVVDTSTIGPDRAADVAAVLAEVGIGYVDAPVSGGVAGARSRSLVVMYAGSTAAIAAVRTVLDGLSDRHVHVGDRPGMAQAIKLANNFLSATALAATSEAVAFCTSAGLEMATVLEVLNSSSGRSAATEDKFVNHVLPGTYASGFVSSLMAKDVRLYLDAVRSRGTATTVATVTTDVWTRFAEADPGADFTAIYRYTVDG